MFAPLVVALVLTPPVWAEGGACEEAVLDAENRLMLSHRDADAWLALAESHRCSEHFHSALAAYERAASLGADREHIQERVDSLAQAREESFLSAEEPVPCVGKKAVARVVEQLQAGLQACSNLAEPDAAGEVVVTFVVEDTGSVGDLVVQSSSIATEAVLACMKTEVSALKFDAEAGKDAVPVNFTVEVSPVEGSSEPPGDPSASPP